MIEHERLRSQETKFGPENNWFKISYLEIYLLISDFLAESPEAIKNWQKCNSFYNKVSLKKPHLLYEPQVTHNCNKIYLLPQQSQKPTHFTNFSANMFLVDVWKHICTASFLDVQALNSQSSWKINVCVYLRISVRQFLFQRCRNLLSGEELNGFLKAARFLGILKFWNIFHLIQTFGNSSIFQHCFYHFPSWTSTVRLWLILS